MAFEHSFDSTSFIPKKPLAEGARVTGRPGLGFLSLIGILLLIVSIVLAVVVFLYKARMEQSIESEKTKLANQQAQFEPSTISDLRALDRRMTAVGAILDNHLALSPIFAEINKYTIKPVLFSKMSVSASSENKSEDLEVELSGKTTAFLYIALQSEEFAKSKYFNNIVVSNIAENDKRERSFTITFTVDRKLALLKSVVGGTTAEGE